MSGDFRAGEPRPPRQPEGVRPGLPEASTSQPRRNWSEADGWARDRERPPCPASLVGQVVRGPWRFPVGFTLFLLLGAFLVGLYFTSRVWHPLVVAAYPFLTALVFALMAPRRVEMEITQTGLVVRQPPVGEVPYEHIREVEAPQRRPGGTDRGFFPIYVCHDQNYFTIPETSDISSETLYAFLVNQPIQPASPVEPIPELDRYYRLQTNLFDPRDVYVFRARQRTYRGKHHRIVMANALGMVLGGIAWCILGVVIPHYGGWIVGGFFLALFGGLLALAGVFTSSPSVDPRACLIVSPGGWALSQGKLKGELKWHELRTLTIGRPSTFVASSSNAHGLTLGVAGAVIVILDTYDRPLELVKDVIEDYWRRWQRREADQ